MSVEGGAQRGRIPLPPKVLQGLAHSGLSEEASKREKPARGLKKGRRETKSSKARMLQVRVSKAEMLQARMSKARVLQARVLQVGVLQAAVVFQRCLPAPRRYFFCGVRFSQGLFSPMP